MRVFCLVVLCTVLCLRVVSYATAEAPSYLGVWKLTRAVAAPWVAPRRPIDAGRPPLIGKSIEFKSQAIVGPAAFACSKPRYVFRDLTPARIFQGAFAAMQARNKAADPDALAARLGFAGPSIKTLETGCAVDLHFVDASTAQVALGGVIYTLNKQ